MANDMISSYTIGFSTHRLESLPFAQKEMAQHKAVVLEEPPSLTLAAVLRGEAEVEEYLWELEAEFPEFGIRQLEILQELWQQGKAILQVEPYLERLVEIHELFAEDTSPVLSLDGRLIAYKRRTNNCYELFLMNADGNNQHSSSVLPPRG